MSLVPSAEIWNAKFNHPFDEVFNHFVNVNFEIKCFKSRFGRILKTHVWNFYAKKEHSTQMMLGIESFPGPLAKICKTGRAKLKMHEQYFTARTYTCAFHDDKFSVVTRIQKHLSWDHLHIWTVKLLAKRAYCYYSYYITIKHWKRSAIYIYKEKGRERESARAMLTKVNKILWCNKTAVRCIVS